MCLQAVPIERASDGKGKKKGTKATKGKGKKKASDSAVLEAEEEETEATQEPARKRRKLQEFDSETTLVDTESTDVPTPSEAGEAELQVTMVEERGSGYPSGGSIASSVASLPFP